MMGCAKTGDKLKTLATANCDKAAIIDKGIYAGLAATNYAITNAAINGDCLAITVSSSGCDGRSWVLDLIDSEAVYESNPPQRMLKLRLVNNEVCAAVFSRTVSFDIRSLRVSMSNSVLLTLAGYNQSLVYNY